MGHPTGRKLGDSGIWGARYLHHRERVQVGRDCLSFPVLRGKRLSFIDKSGRLWTVLKYWIAFQIFCCSDRLGNIDDLQRIYYYKHYLNQENSLLFHSLFYILKAGAEGNQVGWDLSEGLLCLEPPWQLWVSGKKREKAGKTIMSIFNQVGDGLHREVWSTQREYERSREGKDPERVVAIPLSTRCRKWILRIRWTLLEAWWCWTCPLDSSVCKIHICQWSL